MNICKLNLVQVKIGTHFIAKGSDEHFPAQLTLLMVSSDDDDKVVTEFFEVLQEKIKKSFPQSVIANFCFGFPGLN